MSWRMSTESQRIQFRRGKDRVMKSVGWQGVFPAVTTQFRGDFSVDVEATYGVMRRLIADGVSGLIVCGTVGENCSLTRSEKIELMIAARDAAGERVPVLAGIAEHTTAFAIDMAREAQRSRLDGIMLMPALVYASKPRETAAHYRGVATTVDLPLMVYNNPPVYGTDVTPDILATLTDCETIVCVKESSGDTRRFVDLRRYLGDRYLMFAGLDDVVLESVLVGAVGWVSGLSNAFPAEGETLFRLARAGRFEEARLLYEWFMPLLHLDARPDLVQCIKLCEYIMERGTYLTRPPRLQLDKADHDEVLRLMKRALENRPVLPDVGLSTDRSSGAAYPRITMADPKSHREQLA